MKKKILITIIGWTLTAIGIIALVLSLTGCGERQLGGVEKKLKADKDKIVDSVIKDNEVKYKYISNEIVEDVEYIFSDGRYYTSGRVISSKDGNKTIAYTGEKVWRNNTGKDYEVYKIKEATTTNEIWETETKATLIEEIISFFKARDALADTDTYTASDTWTCPAGVTSADVECWGGGGAGMGYNNAAVGHGGGGGGGAYSKKEGISVTPSTGYDVIVGTGASGTTGVGGSGGDSYFDDGSAVLAKGGGGASSSSGATGGAAASGVGDTKYSGGNGGAGASPYAAENGGGGGGGAGDAADGGNGGNAGISPGSGGIGGNTGGGNGGAGGSNANGNNGSTLGGAGGGAGDNSSFTSKVGGSGARGEVRITYTPALYDPFVSSATDAPDPVYETQEIAFEVGWALAGGSSATTIKSKICKTDVLSNGNCTGGFWATSTAFTATNPTTTKYMITGSDLGTKNYYAYVCDDQSYCSATSTAGTFLALDNNPDSFSGWIKSGVVWIKDNFLHIK